MNVALATATTSAIAHHRAHAPLTRCRDDRRIDDVDDIVTVCVDVPFVVPAPRDDDDHDEL